MYLEWSGCVCGIKGNILVRGRKMEAKGYISSDAGPSGTQTTHIFHISILLHLSTDFFSSPLELGKKNINF